MLSRTLERSPSDNLQNVATGSAVPVSDAQPIQSAPTRSSHMEAAKAPAVEQNSADVSSQESERSLSQSCRAMRRENSVPVFGMDCTPTNDAEDVIMRIGAPRDSPPIIFGFLRPSTRETVRPTARLVNLRKIWLSSSFV